MDIVRWYGCFIVGKIISDIHERALRIIYRDYEPTFQKLLKQKKSVSRHQRNLQILATEIFKTKNGLNPVTMDYGEHISSELVLFDWALLWQINIC